MSPEAKHHPTQTEWNQAVKIQTDTEVRLATLAGEVQNLAQRIPDKLSESMVELSLKMDQLIKDMERVRKDLEADYVSQSEFSVLKVEHDQIKKLIWGFIAMVLIAVSGAVIALVVRG